MKITTAQLVSLVLSDQYQQALAAYNAASRTTSDKFDVGLFLESEGFDRDLSAIDITTWLDALDTPDQLQYDIDESSNEVIRVFVSASMRYTETQLHELLRRFIGFNRKLERMILPAFIDKLGRYEQCEIRECTWPHTVNLQFTQCQLHNITLNFFNHDKTKLAIKQCEAMMLDIQNCQHLKMLNSKIHDLHLHNCNFDDGAELVNLSLVTPKIYRNSFQRLDLLNVTGLNPKDFVENHFASKTQIFNADTAWDEQIDALKISNEKIPVIAVPCNFNTNEYCDEMIHWLTKNNQRSYVLLLDNQVPFESFQKRLHSLKIDAIYLPGGEDIPKPYYDSSNDFPKEDPRTNFELALLDWAEEKNIPSFGVCRGMQIIGVREGMKLINIDSFMQTHQKQPMTIYQGNDIFNTLMQKYQKHVIGESPKHETYRHSLKPIYDTTDPTKVIAFEVHKQCSHHQCLDPKTQTSRVQVIMTTNDVIEAIQIKNTKHGSIIYGVQSHPERIYHENQVAKLLMRDFLKHAKQHREKYLSNSPPSHKTIFQPTSKAPEKDTPTISFM